MQSGATAQSAIPGRYAANILCVEAAAKDIDCQRWAIRLQMNGLGSVQVTERGECRSFHRHKMHVILQR